MSADNTLGTVTILSRESVESTQVVIATVAVGTHYPSGGKPITAAHFGLDSIDTLAVIEQCSLAAPTKVAVFDRTNSKLAVLVFDGSNAEDSDDSDNSATVATVRVSGH
jgi:hypothetical protein